jgi:hypothetical protein
MQHLRLVAPTDGFKIHRRVVVGWIAVGEGGVSTAIFVLYNSVGRRKAPIVVV